MHPESVEMGRLMRLRTLVTLYAHSQVLPLIIPLTILVLNIGIIFGVGPLLDAIEEPPWATWLILISCMLLVLFNTILAGYLTYRYAPRFYAREGTVELPGEYGSISSWILYIVTFLGPVFCQPEYLTSRQAVVICLCSYGGFLLYLGRNNFRVGGACFGGLSLLAALGFGLGLPLPFTGQNGFFLTLMGTIVAAGLITLVVVHTFNRRVLRKMREMRIGGATEDTTNSGH